jgi:DNA mismatch repair protein MutS2
LEIASRLGLDEEIIQDARGMINPSELRAEDLIDEIHRQLENARQARSEADQIRQDAENIRAQLSEKLAAIDEERLKVMETAREDARQDLAELRAQIESLHRETVIPDQGISKKRELRRNVQNLEDKLAEPLESEAMQLTQPRTLRAGDRVYVHSLKTDAIVLEIFGNEIEVQVGKMRLKTEHTNISRSKTGKSEGTVAREIAKVLAGGSPGRAVSI